MTGRHTRLILLAILAITVVSIPVFAQTEYSAALRARAEQGDAVAQYNLGVAYDTGQGVPQDYVKTHMWFNVGSDGRKSCGYLD